MAELTIDVGTDDETKQRIIDAAAQQLLWRYTEDPEDGSTVRVPLELQRKLEQQIAEVIREEASKAAPKVAEQILDEGVQLADHWGSASGERQPLRTVIAKRVEAELYDGQSGRRGKGVLGQMIEREVAKVVREELQSTLDDAKAKVAAAVASEAQAALTKAIERGIPGVKV